MREIKFRAWDNVDERMLFVGEDTDVTFSFDSCGITSTKLQDYNDYDDCNFYSLEHLKYMQYTGLKDKNGVEIYEEDVLEVRDELYPFVKNWIGTVKMNCGSYLIETLKDEDDNHHYEYLFNGAQEIKVIGNIYENQELLVVVG